MKTYTTAQVARITKRSDSVISRLIREGKLKATPGKSKLGRKTMLISVEGSDDPKGALINVVHALVPKGGYRKNIAHKKGKKASTPANLAQVLRFMELSEEKRLMLLELGEKAEESTIEVLLGLV